MNYYDQYSKKYIEETINLDMQDLYNDFCVQLEGGAKILDVGCGSGRDLKYFKEAGYEAEGIEPSLKLAASAQKYSGVGVRAMSLSELKAQSEYDGIWASASLLHIPSKKLPFSFEILSKALKNEGVLYFSFKEGDFEGLDSLGRHMTYLTQKKCRDFLSDTSFILKRIWATQDIRLNNTTCWLNVLAIKKS